VNLTTLPGGQVAEFRTYFGVEVGLIHGALDDGHPASWLVFPDGRLKQVNARAYANFDEACAAHVAVWRKRRIRLGLDKPTGPAPTTKLDLFDAVRTEADSETVTVECGAVGKYGARCYRQAGHENGDSEHAGAHIGPIREGGPDAKFVDDGADEMEVWGAARTAPRLVH